MPHLRKIVYFTAIKYGGHTEWEFLWRKYKDCKNAAEREKVLSALCAARNKDVLQRYELSFFTAPFNNIWTLKFKAQPTNAFFATVNQMFGGSSQLPTTAESAVIKSLCRVQTTKQCSAVVVSWEDTPNIWLTAAKIEFIGGPFNLRVRMLLKSTVTFHIPK